MSVSSRDIIFFSTDLCVTPVWSIPGMENQQLTINMQIASKAMASFQDQTLKNELTRQIICCGLLLSSAYSCAAFLRYGTCALEGRLSGSLRKPSDVCSVCTVHQTKVAVWKPTYEMHSQSPQGMDASLFEWEIKSGCLEGGREGGTHHCLICTAANGKSIQMRIMSGSRSFDF